MLTRAEVRKVIKKIVSNPQNAAIVHPRDAPYIEAILEEAFLFEHSDMDLLVDISNLSVAITNIKTKTEWIKSVDHYEIEIVGYVKKNAFKNNRWYRTFMSQHRSDFFIDIFHTCALRQDVNNIITIIRLKQNPPGITRREINCRRAILVWCLCGTRLGISHDLRKLIAKKMWETRFELAWLDKR